MECEWRILNTQHSITPILQFLLMNDIHFIDTTLRDGQQSLWALGMKTEAMLGAAAHMDRIGFESMEFFVSIMIKKYVREHKENPWDWVREGAKHFRRTRLRNHGGLHGSGAMEKLPQSAMKLLAERVVSYGMTLTRTSNCWNDFEELRGEVRDLRDLGMDTIVNLIYSVSPRHTDDYYAQKTREAASIDPYRICFKDVGGLLTPARARTLIPVIMQNAGAVPVEYHAHCNNGLAPLCYIEAVKHGITALHTAVPPLANGSSQPSMFNIAKNLRALGYTPAIDDAAVKPVEEHFTAIAKERLGHRQTLRLRPIPISPPGSRRRNLQFASSAKTHRQGRPAAGDSRRSRPRARRFRLSDHGDAAVAIRRQPGRDQRHRRRALQRSNRSSDPICARDLGQRSRWIMDADVKDKILSRPRAKDWPGWTPPDLSLHQVRQKLGATISDEELLLRVYAGPDAVDALLNGGAPKPQLDGKQSLLQLIEQLSKKKDCHHVYIRRNGVSLTLGKSASPQTWCDEIIPTSAGFKPPLFCDLCG